MATEAERRRLSLEEVSELLAHHDGAIRNFAAEYLAEGRCGLPDSWQKLLNAPKTPEPRHRPALYLLRKLPIPADAIPELIEAANSRSFQKEDREFIAWAISKAPATGLQTHRELIESSSRRWPREILQSINFTLQMAEKSPQAIWSQLAVISSSSKKKGLYYNQLNWPAIESCIDLLADQSFPDESLLNSEVQLAANVDDSWTWLSLFAVQLAGRRRLQSAIPYLIDLCRSEELEMEFTTAIRALVDIGDPDCLQIIENQWDDVFQFGIAEILHSFKHPLAVDIGLRLLNRTEEPDVATYIAYGLLRQLDSAAIQSVADLIDTSRHCLEFIDLRNAIDLVAQILNIDVLGLERWREEVEQEERQFRADRQIDDYQPDLDREFAKRETIVQDSPKTGRNDPCPCGSGKKYKKCCLKKAVENL